MVANRLRDAAAVLEVDSAYRRDAAIMREAADEVDRLRHDIERHVEIACELATECERLRAELANLKALLRSICEEWNEGCDPACDSFGHTDTCKGTNIAQAKRAMRDEIERLRAELAECQRLLHRYRNETPLGHQPHMIAHEVDAALREGGEQMEFECAPRWRDVADELPREAQEVLFVRGEKTVFGAWIGGIFWHNNQKMAAAYWMPLPKAPVQRGSK